MEKPDAFALALAEEANHTDVHDGHVLQIQSDSGTTACQLVLDLAEMFRPHAPNQADGASLRIRTPLEPEHPTPLVGLMQVGRRTVVAREQRRTARKILIDQKAC
jgi:hypothetical protein